MPGKPPGITFRLDTSASAREISSRRCLKISALIIALPRAGAGAIRKGVVSDERGTEGKRFGGFRLNDEQRRAVEARDRDVVVTAGAGSGKTSTLVGRYLHLLADGIEPRHIAAITFTKKSCPGDAIARSDKTGRAKRQSRHA